MASADARSRRVKVVLRARPFLSHENDCFKSVVVAPDCAKVDLTTPVAGAGSSQFSFDACYDESISQEALYEREIAAALPSLLHGINTTVFAYGMTGAGKTHTMQGSKSDPGIIPRAADSIMRMIEQSPLRHCVYMSYLEIYNEKVYDLLDPSETSLNIREDHSRNVVIPNLAQVEVKSKEEFADNYHRGCSNRSTSPTSLNVYSSRSHAIVILKVVSIDTAARKKYTGKLHLIDLAGSEDNRLTDNKGLRMTESTNINSSLFVLSKVVTALNSKSARVPYRDSKLTRLLSDSLGGKSVAIMIANVAPGYNFYSETVRTLNFASKSKSIVNAPTVHSVTEEAPSSIKAKLEEWRRAKRAKKGLPLSNSKGKISTAENVKENTENKATGGDGFKRGPARPLMGTGFSSGLMNSREMQEHIDELVQQQLERRLAELSTSSAPLESSALTRLEKLETALSSLTTSHEEHREEAELQAAERPRRQCSKTVVVSDADTFEPSDDREEWLPEVDGDVELCAVQEEENDECSSPLALSDILGRALAEEGRRCLQEADHGSAAKYMTLADMLSDDVDIEGPLKSLEASGHVYNGECSLNEAAYALLSAHGCFEGMESYESPIRVSTNAVKVLDLLNSGTVQELEKQLHCIGRKRALLIVQQRSNAGDFRKLSELRSVLGAKQLANFIRRNVVEALSDGC